MGPEANCNSAALHISGVTYRRSECLERSIYGSEDAMSRRCVNDKSRKLLCRLRRPLKKQYRNYETCKT